MKNSDIVEVKQPFVSPYSTGTKLQIPSVQDTIILKEELLWTHEFGDVYITVTDQNNEIITVATGATEAAEFTLSESGSYVIRYYGQTKRKYQQSPPVYTDFSYRYSIAVVQNHYPLKKQTIKDVIKRVLQVVEPLTYLGYGSREQERGNRAAARLQSRSAGWDLPLPEKDYSNMTVQNYLYEIGRNVGGDYDDVYWYLLGELQKKYGLTNEQMIGIRGTFYRKKVKEVFPTLFDGMALPAIPVEGSYTDKK